MIVRLSLDSELLPDNLWLSASWLPGRSSVASPLSVARFKGPRRIKRVKEVSHDFWEMTGVLGGHGILGAKGEEIPMARGDIFLTPPGVTHDEYSQDPAFENIWIAFRSPPLDARWSKLPETAWFQSTRSGVLRLSSESLMEEIEQLWLFAGRRHGAIGPELDGRLLAILGRFLRLLNEKEAGQSLDGMDHVMQILRERFHDAIPVKKLAATAGCSLGHFQRAFKRHTGCTVVEFRHKIRLQNAVNLLCFTTLPISEVSEQCGFPDPFYFSRCFQRHTGLSPRAFRRQAHSPAPTPKFIPHPPDAAVGG